MGVWECGSAGTQVNGRVKVKGVGTVDGRRKNVRAGDGGGAENAEIGKTEKLLGEKTSGVKGHGCCVFSRLINSASKSS
jgi:hypothetical protein